MYLSSDTSLELQFTENGGALRSLRFAALPSEVDDLIMQETARREGLFEALYSQGPYTSHNYGTLSFAEDGRFTWTGFNILVPQVIPASALEGGVADMRLFLANSLTDRYNGAFTLRFDTAGAAISSGSASAAEVNFMYTLDNQGFRIEYVPPSSMDGITVVRRASSPMVIYFYLPENQGISSFIPLETPPALNLSEETQSGPNSDDEEDFDFSGEEEEPLYSDEPWFPPDSGADFLPE
jgi:hypothetical protein